ncbi:MAG: hypothetical protein ACPGVO_02925 [Spirulinaceae cyanobacterium]
MTVSRNDIQQLIAEVDQLLSAAETPGEAEQIPQHHELLEKVRWCLSNLARQVEVPGGEMRPLAAPEQQTAQAIAQAVMSQMNVQRQDWLQPMQLELEALRQQREILHRDIRQLESHQRQMSQELLQSVMHRCSESLKQELTTVFDRLQGQFSATLTGAPPSTDAPPALQQLDWLEKLRSLEQQADQLFLSLDQTFHQVFASLEQDVQSYHHSLQHKLGQIHELQQQGLLAASDARAALPQPAAVTAVGQTSPRPGLPAELSSQEISLLQLDAREPLPTLEPLLPNELARPTEPVEQILRLDLPAGSDTPTRQRTNAPAVSADQAWEAWDEYLFTRDPGQDEPLVTDAASRVLTVDVPAAPAPAAASPQPAVSSPAGSATSPELLTDVTTVPDLPRAVQQELFANLGDPAQVAADPEPTLATEGDAAVGTVLFGDPVVAPETAIAPEELTAALDPDAEAETLDPQGPSLEETIASLDDLLDQVSARVAEAPAAIDDADEVAATIPAGETLLTTDEIAAQSPSGQLETVLDDQRMQQLSADLANFEGERSTANSGADATEQSAATPAPTPPTASAPATVTSTEDPAEPERAPDNDQNAPAPNSPEAGIQQRQSAPPPDSVPSMDSDVAAPTPTLLASPPATPESAIPEQGEGSPQQAAPEPAAPEQHSPKPATPELATPEPATPEPDVPEQMVLSALSDLGWDALLDEADIPEGEPDGDLWDERQNTAATTATPSSSS